MNPFIFDAYGNKQVPGPSYNLFADKESNRSLNPTALIGFVHFTDANFFDFFNSFAHRDEQSKRFSYRHKFKDAESLAQKAQRLVVNKELEVTFNANVKSPVTKASAVFIDPQNEIIKTVLTNDFMFVWMVNSVAKRKDIESRFLEGKQINLATDGLKFFGRVSTISKTVQIDRNTGTHFRRTYIESSGFSELMAPMMYDPTISSSDNDQAQFQLSNGLRFGHVVNVVQAAQVVLDYILGAGFFNLSPDERTPNNAFLIPPSILDLFGLPAVSEGKTTAGKVYQVLIGGQTFSSDSTKPSYSNFFPSNAERLPAATGTGEVSNIWRTKDGMLGKFFRKSQPDYISSWSYLQYYLNPALNEMMTKLQIYPDGTLHPTVIIRPIARNTEARKYLTEREATGRDQTPIVYPYFRQPRWILPNGFVTGSTVGREDLNRLNHFHITADFSMLREGEILVGTYRADGGWAAIDTDISLSGVRSWPMELSCLDGNVKDIDSASSESSPDQIVVNMAYQWNQLAMDRLYGGHLKFSGTIMTPLIEEPISVGDVLESDGVVYTINNIISKVVQNGHIASGSTTLVVADGVSTNEDNPWPMLVGIPELSHSEPEDRRPSVPVPHAGHPKPM